MKRAKQMIDEWKAFWWLVGIGAIISLGKLLSGGESLTLRLVLGRVITGAATSVVAGLILLQFPDISPVVLLAAGSAMGIAGQQTVEAMVQRWGGK